MFVRVMNTSGSYAGDLNLDTVDMIKLEESSTSDPNTLIVYKGEITKTFKVSKGVYQGVQRYLSRYGITA